MPLKAIRRMMSRSPLNRSSSQLSSASANSSSSQLKSLAIDSNRLAVTPSVSINDVKRLVSIECDIENDKELMLGLKEGELNDLKKKIKNQCNLKKCNSSLVTTLVDIENVINAKGKTTRSDGEEFSDEEKTDHVKEEDACSCVCSCAEDDSSGDEGEVSPAHCVVQLLYELSTAFRLKLSQRG
ncbi:hypothetical protein EGW08_018913 [Elysia chlorotica]|uniref:Uncharacterized protein n=1 Tax=Elysia chlorotica TaxID=188477 RepID=A0A3S1B2B5_ELYCH|nr:hypothetical protein EGW08_018913 [Elysia chlorotica]